MQGHQSIAVEYKKESFIQVQFLLSLELFSMVEQKVKVQYSVDHVSYLLLTVVQHYTHIRSEYVLCDIKI